MKRCAERCASKPSAQQKSKVKRPCFFVVQYSLSHRPKRGSPSILTIECVLADERLRLLYCNQRAWSYFLPRLGPGPISTRDSEIATGPEPSHVVARTLARPRQIVTMIVTERHKFMPSPPFGVGRSPHNWSDREIRGTAATQCLPRGSVNGGHDSHALLERAGRSSRDC